MVTLNRIKLTAVMVLVVCGIASSQKITVYKPNTVTTVARSQTDEQMLYQRLSNITKACTGTYNAQSPGELEQCQKEASKEFDEAYTVAAIDIQRAEMEKQFQGKLDLLQANIQALSNSKDALTTRLNDLEARLKIQEAK